MPSRDPGRSPSARAAVRHQADLARLVLALILTGVGLLALSAGAAAGSLALLALGGPPRWPSTRGIVEALRRGGLPEGTLVPLDVPARHSQPFAFVDGGNQSLFVKVVGRDERDAQLLSRLWRNLRVKGIEDEKPVSSPRTSLERQSLVALRCARPGGERRSRCSSTRSESRRRWPPSRPLTAAACRASTETESATTWCARCGARWRCYRTGGSPTAG